jgi:plastocyanin
MGQNLRRGPLLALLTLTLALGAGLAACGEDDESDSDSAATTTETTTTETTTEAAGPSTGTAPKAVKVEIADFTFDPATTTIQVGGKVNWDNQDEAVHTATAEDGSFDTGDIEPDKRGNATFKEAGTFAYFCEIHPDMKGTVEVVE